MTASVTVGRYTPEPPVDAATLAGWRRELRAAFPVVDGLSYPDVVWEPGTPDAPVGRWAIYDFAPVVTGDGAPTLDPLFVVEELEGPPPEVRVAEGQARGVVVVPNVTRRQWELWRSHRRFGRWFWVVQGDHGGHQRYFTPLEQKWCKLYGIPSQPPRPGDLPYAPFDQRVIAQLVARDRLRKADGALGRLKRLAAQGVDVGDPGGTERDLREAIVAFLAEQLEESASQLARQLRRDDVVRRDTTDWDAKLSALESGYIETGRILA